MASVGSKRSLPDLSDDSVHLECSSCKYKDIKAEANHCPPQCRDNLCESCKQTHQGLSFTRNHKLVSGNKMPKKGEHSNDLPSPELALCACNTNEVTTYCEDHNKVVCSDCKLLQHISCNTVDISAKCTGIESSSSETTESDMLGLKEKPETLHTKRQDDIHELASLGERAREKVKAFRRDLNEQLDRMEGQSLADIDQCVREQKLPIQDHIDTAGAALHKMESDNRQCQAARGLGDKRISFIQDLQLSKTIDQIKPVIEDISKEVQKPSISFECDPSLKRTSTPSLGKINRPPAKESRKAVGEMNILSTTIVTIKIPFRIQDPCISGSVFMPSGELVLCDCNNSKLNVLKVDLTLKENITLPSGPWDVSVMNKDEVVITIPNSKYLLFVTVYPTLRFGSSVKFDQTCRSVQVHDNEIYVLFDNGEIRIIDRAGIQQKNVYNTFSFPRDHRSIDISTDGMLCVSELLTHTVRGFYNGNEIYKYTDPQLQRPFGVFIDDHQNVLACGYGSHNIHVIDKNGKKVKILLSFNDGVALPHTLSFRQSDNTLVVGGYSSPNIELLVCKMQ